MKKFLLFALLIIVTLSAHALDIKILIAEAKNNINVKASGPFSIKDLGSSKRYNVKKSGSFKISREGKTLQAGTVKSQTGFELILTNQETSFSISNIPYNGVLIIKPASKGINIIEQTDIENYLYGVLPYEMSYSWPIEALKAQAVAARTYTMKSLESRLNKDFDLYSDVRSQMYKGSVKLYESIKQAVDSTKGEVLKYKNDLFYTYYHANCGGHTDIVPWLKSSIKPLEGAKCGYDTKSISAHWKTTLTAATINNFLKTNKIKGTIKKVKIGKKFPSGRAQTLQIITTKEKTYVNCNTFRVAVGSTKFKSCFITDISNFTFEGKGYGHGAGMCQDGAKGMASDGKTYKQILSRYYPDSDIKQI